MIVYGTNVDPETRCAHYHSDIDRIAIKFYCCGRYFSCYLCHEEHGCGNSAVWPKQKQNEPAVLCGACGHEMSVRAYLACESSCPSCKVSFNPGCSRHKHLYFE